MVRQWLWIPLVLGLACGGASRTTTSSLPPAAEVDDTSAGRTTSMTATGMTGVWALTGCTGTAESVGETGALADVEAVAMTGGPTDWTVSVTVRSPDVDCGQYASWWELLTPEGELVYRRILNHSHADEQPFTRASEGSVALEADTVVRVRAYLHPSGYGGQVMEGTPSGGFSAIEVESGWADELGTMAPLPEECWY